MANLNQAAIARNLPHSGTWGNLSAQAMQYVAAAAAIGDVIYLGAVPAGTKVTDVRMLWAALGAATTISIGYINSAGNNATYFLAAHPTSTPGSEHTAFIPIDFALDTFIIATVGGGAITGEINVVMQYIYKGAPA